MWDMWRCEDAAALRSWLLDNTADFEHNGQPVDASLIGDAIFDQCFMLNARHLAKLKADTGVGGPAGMSCHMR